MADFYYFLSKLVYFFSLPNIWMMDWEKRFSSIFKETESNLAKVKVSSQNYSLYPEWIESFLEWAIMPDCLHSKDKTSYSYFILAYQFPSPSRSTNHKIFSCQYVGEYLGSKPSSPLTFLYTCVPKLKRVLIWNTF